MEKNKRIEIDQTNMNKDLYDTELMSYNSKTGEYEWVTPRVMTKTIYNDQGENLDDILKFTPSDLKAILYEILDGAPDAYNSFKEVAEALDKNKNSISEIFNEINKRVKKPQTGSPGQVLKLNESGEIIFADDKDTVYKHPNKHKPWEIETDKDNRFVSDEEKETWNNKLDETSDISKAKVENGTEKITLAEFLKAIKTSLDSLNKSKGKADGYASLDTQGKIPKDQLPAEALKDTTYDLSSYATSEDLKSYAKADDLSAYAKSTDLENLAKSTDLEDYQPKLSYTPEDANKKGKANGYASLDANGQVPADQLPAEALKDTTYDLSVYAKNENLKNYQPKLNYTPEDADKKGKANGYASLDANGQVPADQLPSYVDDVVEITDLPKVGEKGKIYVDTNTHKIYRWSGSQFINIIDTTALEDRVNKKIEDLGKDLETKTAGINESISTKAQELTTDYGDKIKKVTEAHDTDKKALEKNFSDLSTKVDKKPDVISLTEEEFSKLTTFKDNTLYLVQENA